MIPIIKFGAPETELQKDLYSIEAPLANLDTYLRLGAVALNDALNVFWALPDERLCAVLNHYGPEQVEGIFTAHAEKAAMINQLLAARGLPPVAEIGAKKQITVNPSTGLFEIVPPPTPEVPLPDPEVVTPPEG